jgi:carbonic anhydrase
MKARSFVLGIFLVLMFFSCTSSNQEDAHGNNVDQSHQDNEQLHWDYEGEVDPDHWAELSPAFIACAEGHFQSPIDLETYTSKKLHADILNFEYNPSPVDIVNNGHTIQANVENKNRLIIGETAYTLKQLHFHAPAEHQIDGIIFPMEMHLVHSNEEGKLAVVGVFIKEGLENEAFKIIWNEMPDHLSKHRHPIEKADLLHLIPENHAVIHYSGSLTTPPCSEGVEWYVMENPLSLSKAQIGKFKKLYAHNNRPIQERDGRLLEEYTE